jgi:hypothetical protein
MSALKFRYFVFFKLFNHHIFLALLNNVFFDLPIGVNVFPEGIFYYHYMTERIEEEQ